MEDEINVLAQLRQKMTENGIDAYIIPSSDPHQSEYVADHWKTRAWISGFTGSAGVAVITKDHAGLWTDSRYFLQAEEQLADSEFELHKQQIPHAPEHIQWIRDRLPAGSKVAFDGMLFSVSQVRNLAKSFYDKQLDIDYNKDFIGDIWADRKPLPTNQLFEHDITFAGISRKDKLEAIKNKMGERNADLHLVTTLDNIAWTLNLRSNDVDCNPVSIAYLIIGQRNSYLFIDQEKVNDELKEKLGVDKVLLKPYDEIADFLSAIPEGQKILMDPSSTNIKLFNLVNEVQLVKGDTISAAMKAVKNKTEIKHIRKVMVKDGVALLKLYRWLEHKIQNRPVSEYEVAQKLIEFRKAGEHYHGESFDAIVGFNGNGAIVHYKPEKETSSKIRPHGILLLDSGGQYSDGTTDITRTTALGVEVTEEQKRNFTLVLKGHIALATFKFPKGTRGIQMDTLARQFLWKHGLNYGHGTGHGVGFFLNVHEPPQGFATSVSQRGTTVFEAGMFTSNEPGFYKNGEYGIRIENLMLTVEDEKTEYGEFLKFETITLFPIDLKLIDASMLNEEEKLWLNDYHKEVYAKMAPHLDLEEDNWLKEKCRTLE